MQENKQNISPIKGRILEYADSLGISKRKFYEIIGVSRGTLESKTGITEDIMSKFFTAYPEISIDWLITGKGDMLKQKDDPAGPTRIPLYKDVSSIGGYTQKTAGIDSVSAPSEWIDIGDWFTNATAAIYHHGDSMMEYPNGCILVLQQIHDIQSVFWGRNYVIETDELRVTKRLQRGKTEDSIRAYSTNEETYQDGTSIYEPMDIRLASIRRLFIVLGCVIRQQSSDVYGIKHKD
jgi:hypothetical protein